MNNLPGRGNMGGGIGPGKSNETEEVARFSSPREITQKTRKRKTKRVRETEGTETWRKARDSTNRPKNNTKSSIPNRTPTYEG